jgi:hypothetical protein
MPLNLKKYDGRYIGILYGQVVMLGKLHVGESAVILEEAISVHDAGLEEEWGFSYASVRQCGETHSLEVNSENVNAIRDITSEIYSSLYLAEFDAKRMPVGKQGYRDGCVELERLSKLRKELEQILSKEEKLEIDAQHRKAERLRESEIRKFLK